MLVGARPRRSPNYPVCIMSASAGMVCQAAEIVKHVVTNCETFSIAAVSRIWGDAVKQEICDRKDNQVRGRGRKRVRPATQGIRY